MLQGQRKNEMQGAFSVLLRCLSGEIFDPQSSPHFQWKLRQAYPENCETGQTVLLKTNADEDIQECKYLLKEYVNTFSGD